MLKDYLKITDDPKTTREIATRLIDEITINIPNSQHFVLA